MQMIKAIYIALILIIFLPLVLLFTFITSGFSILMSVLLMPVGNIDNKFIKMVRK